MEAVLLSGHHALIKSVTEVLPKHANTRYSMFHVDCHAGFKMIRTLWTGNPAKVSDLLRNPRDCVTAVNHHPKHSPTPLSTQISSIRCWVNSLFPGSFLTIPSGMPHLLDCPPEVLLLIASYLPVGDKTRLVRVCRILHEVAEPTLHHEVSMEWTGTYYTDNGSVYNAAVLPPIHLLLIRTLTCPRLARLVKSVRFSGFKDHPLWYSAATSELSVDDSNRLTDLVKSSGLAASYRQCALDAKPSAKSEEEPWVRYIREGDVDLYQALFLSRLPNIKYLHIGFDPDIAFRYVSATLHQALCSNTESLEYSSFRSLLRVDLYAGMFCRDLGLIYYQCNAFDICINDFLPFFYLPRLQEFRVAMPDGEGFLWPTTPPCASALRILRLQRSHVEVEILERLLVVTPCLEILEYDFCCGLETSRFRSPHYLRSAGLDRALAHVKPTLKILRISVHFYYGSGDTYYDDPNPNFGIDGILHSLKDFQTLTEVEIPFTLILEPNVSAEIPPNIESLVFRDDMALYQSFPWRSGLFLKCLPTYLLCWSTHNPNLAVLGLNLNESQDDWDEGALTAFTTLCQSMHTTPKVHKEPWDCSCPGTPVFAADRFR